MFPLGYHLACALCILLSLHGMLEMLRYAKMRFWSSTRKGGHRVDHEHSRGHVLFCRTQNEWPMKIISK